MKQEGSQASIQVNYRLESMVTAMNGRRRELRRETMARFPLCILYGSFEENFTDTFLKELPLQMGSEHSCISIRIPDSMAAETAMEQAIAQYREWFNAGRTFGRSEFLIPVIFMAERFRSEDMRLLLEKLYGKLKQKGYYGSYRFLYYCIYNYEDTEAGNRLKKELSDFFRKEVDSENSHKCPLGIFTNDNHAVESRKYYRAVQVIANHIFLLCSKTDGLEMQGKLRWGEEFYFTLGYWKLDVLKQKVNDCLIEMLRRQNTLPEQTGDYGKKVEAAVERLLDFSEEEWMERFQAMPVLYSEELEKLLYPGWGEKKRRLLRKSSVEYGRLCGLLYGREGVFGDFLYANLGSGEEKQRLKDFFESDIGNREFVKDKLKETLVSLRQQSERRQREIQTMQGSALIDNGVALERLLLELRENCWKSEAALVRELRKQRFLEAAAAYLESESFQERLKEIERCCQEETALLRVLRREIAWDDRFSFMDEIRIPENSVSGSFLKWYEDVLSEETFQKLAGEMQSVQSAVIRWLEENLVEVLNKFLMKIDVLKMSADKMDVFYAAKLDTATWEASETGYLYLTELTEGARHQSESLRSRLAAKKFEERNWQSETCFEFFCIKELKDLAEVYNID